jgi:hypothetical protein
MAFANTFDLFRFTLIANTTRRERGSTFPLLPKPNDMSSFRVNVVVRGRRAQLANKLIALGMKRSELVAEGIELLYERFLDAELRLKRVEALSSASNGREQQ